MHGVANWLQCCFTVYGINSEDAVDFVITRFPVFALPVENSNYYKLYFKIFVTRYAPPFSDPDDFSLNPLNYDGVYGMRSQYVMYVNNGLNLLS